MHTVVLLIALVAQHTHPLPGVAVGPSSGAAAAIASPQVTFTAPVSASIYETSAVSQALGGSLVAGSAAITGAAIVCTGATSVSSTSVAGAAATTWTRAQTFSTGTTLCTVTVTDASGRTAQVAKTFIVTNPDAGAPTMSAGDDASTSSSSLSRAISCSDDVACTSITWSGPGGSDDCPITSGNGTSVSANCTFLLATTGTCGATRVNTITVTARDQSGNSTSDTVDITRTTTLTITSSTSIGEYATGVAKTGAALTGSGGASCSYTWGTNGAGSASSLNTADADCAGVSLSTSGVPSGTATQTAGRPATCSWTASLNDGTTTVTQGMTMTVVDPTAQTYFQQISALTEAQQISACATWDTKGCSLQNQNELNALSDQNPSDETVYDATADAAKVTWAQVDPSIGNNIRVPLHYGGVGVTDSYLFIWDVKYGESWARNTCPGGKVDYLNHTGLDHKEYQFQVAPTSTDDGHIHIEVKTEMGSPVTSLFDDCTQNNIGALDFRTYGNFPNTDAQMRYASPNPLFASDGKAGVSTETMEAYPIKKNVWGRYIVEIRLNRPHTEFTSWTGQYGSIPSGTYHMVSFWYLDETRGPVRILYQVPFERHKGSKAVTSLTHVGAVATATTGTSAHGFGAGQEVVITGATPTDYNGTFVIDAVPTSTTFTYTMLSTPASNASGASIKSSNADTFLSRWFPEHNTSANHECGRGTITVLGANGSTVPKNTALTTGGLTFKTDTGPGANGVWTVAGGSVAVTVTAQDVDCGPSSNIAAGSVLTFTTLPSGITQGPTAAAAFTGGDWAMDGDLISYERWFSVLKNYSLPATPENDTTIFQRPR